MKKVLSLVLALAMVLGSFSFVSAAPMSDVAGTVYEEAVTRLALLEVLTGYPDGSFKPENTITRAEFAAVAVRIKGLQSAADAAKGLATGFTDVPAGNWAAGYVGTAGKLGIVNGIGNGLFAPAAPVKYEEAVTMIVRALGYEASAQTKGGYPYGYLIVANEIGLLDQVKGTQGAPAPRGIVAQIADNALEIPMMIQVGFGVDAKWVVSGSKEHGDDAAEQYLLDSLGFDSVLGRVTKVNSNRKGITVSVEDEDEIDRLGKKSVSIDVPAGFDIYAVEGLETKFWYKGDIIITKVQEEAKYDALNFIAKDDELELITEDEAYEIGEIEDADFYYDITIDGENFDEKDFKDISSDKVLADYAKVVLNNDDEIIWAQGYTFDGFLVVDKVEDNDVIGADNYDEVDAKDFLIVKDGKEISLDDLEEGDVFYYNDDEEFAVVSNKSIAGQIERIYTSKDEVKFAGKNYTFAEGAVYLDDKGKVDELEVEMLEELMDEEEEVTMFFNFHNEIVLVLVGDVTGSSDYYVITKNSNAYEGRGGWLVSLDVRNSAGEKLALDLDADFVNSAKDADLRVQNAFDGGSSVYGGFTLANDQLNMEAVADLLTKEKVVEITLDKDGDPKEVVIMNASKVLNNENIESDDSKVKASVDSLEYKLKSNTVVFYDETDKAILFSAAAEKIDELKNATIYAENGNIVAIVGETKADTKTISGVLKKDSDVSRLASGYYEFKLEVNGKSERYVTEDDDYSKSFVDGKSFVKGDVIDLKISNSTGKIVENGFEKAANGTNRAVSGTYVSSRGNKFITINDGTNVKEYELESKAVIYDADLKTDKSLSDLKVGDPVTVFRNAQHSRYIQYVRFAATVITPPTPGEVSLIGVKATGAVTTQGVAATGATPAVTEVKATNTTTAGGIKLVSKLAGTEGNAISLEIVAQTDANKELVVAVTGKTIKVGLATDFAKDISSTKADVVAAINANASALVTASVATANKDEMAVVVGKANLAGGVDAAAAKPAVAAADEVYTLTITSGATNYGGTITVKGLGADVDVAVVKGDTAAQVATKIIAAIGANATAAGYNTTSSSGDKVVLTANAPGTQADLVITVVDKAIAIN